MYRHLQTIFTGLIPIFYCLIGCTTPVLVDYDREAAPKFNGYKCFVIDTSELQKNSEGLIFSPIANRRFIREIETTLIERGYSDDCPSPDFRVWFHASIEQITELDFHFPNTATYFRYRSFHPNDGFFSPPYIDRYELGTFLIDIIDATSGDVVWRGTYTERLARNPHNDEETHFIISKILDRFPPEEITGER